LFVVAGLASRHGCRASSWRVLNSEGEGSVFFDFYGDAAQLPTCYLSSAFALGFVALETEFCLVDIIGPEHPHNMAWGDDDGKTLYLCAKTGLYRIRLNITGIHP